MIVREESRRFGREEFCGLHRTKEEAASMPEPQKHSVAAVSSLADHTNADCGNSNFSKGGANYLFGVSTVG